MSYLNYRRLSLTEKGIYNKLRAELSAFRLSVCFRGVECESIHRAYKALLEDNPVFFWLSGAANSSWTTLNGVIQEVTTTFSLANGYSEGRIRAMHSALITEVRRIVQRARQLDSHYERILFVHDYLVDHTDYISTAPRRYDAYGCLVEHRAVCAGYAKAFQLIMEELGYECGYVRGYDIRVPNPEEGRHAWNYIKIENDCYFIDVTWDDPVAENPSGCYDNKTHDYFCITSGELALTHRISKEYDYPVCRGTKYNYYLRNGYFMDSYSFAALSELARRQLRYSKGFTVRFPSKKECDRAMYDLIENRRVYKIPGIGSSIIYRTSKSGLILTVHNA